MRGKINVCLGMFLLCASSAYSGEIERTISFSRNDLTFSKSEGYDIVDLKGYPGTVGAGEPRLPRVVHALVIPAGADPTGVEIVSRDLTEIAGTYDITPARPHVPLPMPGKVFAPREVEPDPAIYSLSKPYPELEISIVGVGKMNGYQIVHVEIFPVRYVPARRLIQMATSITYKLKYTESSTLVSIPTTLQQEMFGNGVRSVVTNPEDISSFSLAVRKNPSRVLLPSDNYPYVIITQPPMDTVFQRLADWKTKKGVRATVVTVDWINANYSGYDTQEAIRNFIIDAKNTWGTVYVLLGGQADQKTAGQNIVPARRALYTVLGMGYYPDEDSIPCDLYYSDLDGTWDDDGDHVYGELTDNVDMYADVYVGRAPVYTVAQAQNFVYKALTYEKNPPSDHIKKLMLPTAILWASYEERPIQDSIARMTPTGWFDAKMYERDGTLSQQGMIDSLDVGYGMGHWEGHGNEVGIYMGGPFLTSSDADNLVNGDKLGIANSIACFTGAWDQTPGGDCFAEHLVNRVGGGLVAAIMNSRYGWGAYVGGSYVPGPSERIDTTFYARIFQNGMYRAGAVHAAAKDAWVPYADSGNQYDMTRWCIYDLNLMGDPELPLWTDVPDTLNVAHNAVVPIGTSSFTVTVTNNGTGVPVESAFVCCMMDSTIYETGYTNGAGLVMLSVTPVRLDTMCVTASAQNYIPNEGHALVICPDGPYISYLTHSIDDDSSGASLGNGDSIVDAGEIIELPVSVVNYGSDTGYTVEGTLRTADTFAAITDSSESFGNMAPGDTAHTSSFVFEVDSTCPNNHTIQFDLVLKDSLDSTWTSAFSIGTAVYAMDVLPQSQDSSGFEDDTLWYVLTVENKGTSPDSYDLSIAGNSWTTTVWNSAGTSEITNTGAILRDSSVKVLARVEIPGSVSNGEIDTVQLGAVSTIYSTVSDSGAIRTSGYTMHSLPFQDGFETGLADWNLSGTANWAIYAGTGQRGTGGAYEGDSVMVMTCASSGTYSWSYADVYLKLAGETGCMLDYYWRTYSLSSSEHIYLDIYDGTWHVGVDSLTGDDTDWQNVHVDMSAYDMIDGFIVRLRAYMNYYESSDAAYVDKFKVYVPEHGSIAGTVTDAGTALPVEGAIVEVLGAGLLDTSDVNGEYQVNAIETGTYDVTCAASAYLSQTEYNVPVLANDTTIVDFALTAPDIEVSPDSFGASLALNNSTTDTLFISNTGTDTLAFNINESHAVGLKVKTLRPDFRKASVPDTRPTRVSHHREIHTNGSQTPTLDYRPLAGTYTGTHLHFGLSDYGEIMPFQYPAGNEHLQSGSYYSGYTICYNDGSDHVEWAGYGTHSGIVPVSYTELVNDTDQAVIEVVTRTGGSEFEITQRFTFDKSDKFIRINSKLKNTSGTELTDVVFKDWADWDMDGGAGGDNWDYDSTYNMIYASEVRYAAIAGSTPPDFRDIDGWDDYDRRFTDQDYPNGPVSSFDGLEILHYELGTLSPGAERELTFAYGTGDNLSDLQATVGRALSAGDWLFEDPTAGSVLPGETDTVLVTFNSTGLVPDTTYKAWLRINSNDPDEPVVSVLCTLYVQGAPIVSYNDYTVDDDSTGESTGNNNGIPEAGETVEMPVTLINAGSDSAYGVSAVISTADSFITLSDSVEDFGDIPPDSTALCLDDYVFSVDPVCPDSHTVTFVLDITEVSHSWADSFDVVVRHYGDISGEITDRATGLGIPGAIVVYTGQATGADTADGAGNYRISDLAGGAYLLTASAAGFLNSNPVNATVPPDTVISFVLGAPDIYVSPDSFEASLTLDDSLTRTLLISNTGSDTLTFTIFESDSGVVKRTNATGPRKAGRMARGSSNPGAGMDLSRGKRLPFSSVSPTPFVSPSPLSSDEDTISYDDGTAWSYLGVANAYYAVRFTPTEGCRVLAGLVMAYDPSLVGTPCTLFVWDDNGGVPGNVVAGPIAYTPLAYPNWDRVSLTLPVGATGDFHLGYWVPGDPTGQYALVDNDGGARSLHSTDGGASWIVPGTSGDLMIRAIVEYDPVGWLSENPTSGSVPPGETDTVLVTFNSTGLVLDTTYKASLKINSNDPDEPVVSVPVTLTVVDTSLPRVTVISPDSGEVWLVGASDTIRWEATDDSGIDSVSIHLSLDGGSSYPDTIARGEPNDSAYAWTLPDTFSATCRIKVIVWDIAENRAEDESNYDFVIAHDGQKGDIDRDGEVTILDIQRMINIIQERGTPPTSYELWAADINEDGEINILDIMEAINIIQGYEGTVTETARLLKKIGISVGREISLTGEVHPTLVSSGDTAIVSIPCDSGFVGKDSNMIYVNLENLVGVGAAQIRIGYDTLLTAREADTTFRSGMMSIDSKIDSNYIQILLLDMSDDTIAPGSGPIIRIPFYISSEAEQGDSVLLHVERVILSDVDAGEIPSQGVNGWFHFKGIDVEDKPLLPKEYELSGISPNPIARRATIRYAIPQCSHTTLKVYDVSGKLVRTLVDGHQKPAYYSVAWLGRDNHGKRLSKGVYFVRFTARSTDGSAQSRGYESVGKVIKVR